MLLTLQNSLMMQNVQRNLMLAVHYQGKAICGGVYRRKCGKTKSAMVKSRCK
ncbi:hypothetical protein KCP76_19040 [Salmonella enterica subsp. enterica serovar Weltevreden]|nr:hypothetical protein KCP76_19040 [Salmonella enterica subsp. enterica serovar Weltevreden]